MKAEDLIQQYITTGLRLPYHQMKQLNSNQLKSYLRTRLITIDYKPSYQQYEFVLAPVPVRKQMLSELADHELIDLLNGKTDIEHTTLMGTEYYPVEPIVDFATIVKMVLEVSDEKSTAKFSELKNLIVNMVEDTHSQQIYKIEADQQQIYDLLLNSPDFNNDKKRMRYFENILATTDTYTPFKSGNGKQKLDTWGTTILFGLDNHKQKDILRYLFSKSSHPKELMTLLDQYDEAGSAYLEFMTFDEFLEIMETKHPLKFVELMKPKRSKYFVNLLKKNAEESYGGLERYIRTRDNKKETAFIFQHFAD